MPEVCLLEFDTEKRHFAVMEDSMIELPSIPTKGDKVVRTIDGIGYVFDVYDVHYSENGIDVNLIRIADVTDYNSSRFPDIKPLDQQSDKRPYRGLL
jgi:hypothetical protein